MNRPSIPRHWRALLIRLALLYGIAITVGLVLERPWLAIAAVSTALLCWSLWRTYQLDHWARGNNSHGLSAGNGIWQDVFAAINSRWASHKIRNDKLIEVVQEIRRANRALPDGIVAMDRENRIRWLNAAAGSLLGLKRGRDAGQPLTNLLRDPALTTWIENEAGQFAPLVIPSPIQDQAFLQLQGIDYAQDRRLVIVRDITELHLAETMKKDFVANVSHELRTPLTVICGYLETLDEEVPPHWESAFVTMLEQSARMRGLVDDLLTLSRLDASHVLESETEIVTAELLQNILNEAKLLSDGSHRIRLDMDSNANILGDATDLHSAFMNLVSNAIRYTPEGGRIIITWRESADGWLEFSVSDNGPGIGAEHLARITERFYRVSKDRSRESGGTGLGLAIVKHVMSLHGGLLAMQSEPGEGSHFTCRFPPARKAGALSRAS